MKLAIHPTKPFVIAELGTSCDGSVGNMIELARHAVAAGASAIKVQDHSLQRIQDDAKHPAWFQGSTGLESRAEYVARQVIDMRAMRRFGPECPIIVSVFDARHVSCLMFESAEFRPDALKVASGQVTNHELIRACVATGKPIIVSSGMTTWDELHDACELIPDGQLWAVLECTSEYPCPPERVALSPADEHDIGGRLGFSDHTPADSTAAAIVALTRGARVFERHVTFSQKMYGSDAKHACTLEQFEHYCRELDMASRIPTRDIRDENAERLKDVREQFLVRTA